MIAHEGHDASEDGTGRGVPLVATTLFAHDVAPTISANYGKQPDEMPNAITLGPASVSLESDAIDRSGEGDGRPNNAVAFALRGREDGAQPEVCGDGETIGSLRAASGGSSRDYIAFTCKDDGRGATDDLAPTLRAMENTEASTNGGGQLAVAFQDSQSGTRLVDAHATLDANNGSRRRNGVVAGDMAVRRLTVVECERLQGFPDAWTQVPFRGKPAADGPRYRALGNSMAVPVMRWIGERIAFVEALCNT